MGLDGIKSIWARNTLKSQGKLNLCQFFKYPNLKLTLNQSISWTFSFLASVCYICGQRFQKQVVRYKGSAETGIWTPRPHCPELIILPQSISCFVTKFVVFFLSFIFFSFVRFDQPSTSPNSTSRSHKLFFFFFFFFFGWVLYKPTLMFSRCMFGQTCVVVAVAVVVVAAVVAALCVETLLARSRSG